MHPIDLVDTYRACSVLYIHLIDFFASYPGYKEVYPDMLNDLRLLACSIDSCMRDLLDEILKEVQK